MGLCHLHLSAGRLVLDTDTLTESFTLIPILKDMDSATVTHTDTAPTGPKATVMDESESAEASGMTLLPIIHSPGLSLPVATTQLDQRWISVR